MDIPPFSLCDLTPRQARTVYHACVEYVMEHHDKMEHMEAHPVGRELLGIYRAFMRLSNVAETHRHSAGFSFSVLPFTHFPQSERDALAAAPIHISHGLRMRDETVRGFTEVMYRSIRTHVRDTAMTTGL